MKRTQKVAFIFLLILISVFSFCACSRSNSKSRITMRFNSGSCLERNYTEIKSKLEKEGFTNITIEPQKKGLGFARATGNVSYISIGGRNTWDINHIFDAEDLVIIKYWE